MSLPKYDYDRLKEVLLKLDLGELVSLEAIKSGTSTENYKAITSKDQFLVRYYPNNLLDSGSEFRVLNRLHDFELPVPQQIKFIPTGNKSRPFVLMEFIEGRILAELYENNSISINQNERFVENLVKIHKIEWQSLFQAVNLPDYKDNPFAYTQRVYRNRVHDAEALKLKDETNQVLMWMEKHSKIPLLTLGLIHGDYHPLNIILKENDEFIILDWEGVDIGDIRTDVAMAALVVGVLRGKDAEKLFIEEYEQIYGMEISDLDFFTVAEAYHRIIKIFRILESSSESERNPLYVKLLHYFIMRVNEITEIDLSSTLSFSNL